MRKHGGIHTWKCVRRCIGITNNTGAFFYKNYVNNTRDFSHGMN